MIGMRHIVGALSAALACGAVAPAGAQAIVSTGESFVEARLIAGSRQADGSRLAGLSLTIADGWKTYWRSPGEAGVPPSFDWSGSTNLGAAEVLWPRPELFESFGFQTVGYSERVVLPILLTPETPGRPMAVALRLNIGVCKDLCVLEEIALGADIAPDAPDDGASDIAASMARLPLTPAEAGLARAECRLSGQGRDHVIDLELDFAETPVAATVVIEPPAAAWITGAESRMEGTTLRATARVRFGEAGGWLDRSALRITVLAENYAADIRGCAAPAG